MKVSTMGTSSAVASQINTRGSGESANSLQLSVMSSIRRSIGFLWEVIRRPPSCGKRTTIQPPELLLGPVERQLRVSFRRQRPPAYIYAADAASVPFERRAQLGGPAPPALRSARPHTRVGRCRGRTTAEE